MKHIIIFGIIIFSSFGLKAQIFSQKTAQLRRLAEQIAALSVYKDYLKKGYNIARTGLGTINDLKNREFSLHRTFFGSLKLVNPNIKRSSKVAEVILMDLKIRQAFTPTIRLATESRMYGEEDLTIIKKAITEIKKDSERKLNDLNDLIKDGGLELKDDERINRIDGIYSEMCSLYSFNETIKRDVLQLSKVKRHEEKEIGNVKILHGLD